MNYKFNSGHAEDVVYAVSGTWFHAWQRFVRGDSEGAPLNSGENNIPSEGCTRSLFE